MGLKSEVRKIQLRTGFYKRPGYETERIVKLIQKGNYTLEEFEKEVTKIIEAEKELKK